MKTSAGLLMYRLVEGRLEVLLVHPGGPFWKNKDLGAWTISKGEPNPGEDPFDTACREFTEETGIRPEGPFLELRSVRQKAGKTIRAWAFAGDCDAGGLKSNTFRIEWPPDSGQMREFPEIDRAGFFTIEEARGKINPAQVPLLEQLASEVGGRGSGS